MATATELMDEAPVTRIAPEDIAAKQAAAAAAEAAKPGAEEIIKGDVVLPPSDSFNTMASKLEKLMQEATAKPAPAAEKSAAPDPNEKVKTDSRKPAPKTDATPPKEAVKEPETITSPKAADWKAVREKKEAAEKEAQDWRTKHDALTRELSELKAKPSADPAILEAQKREQAEIIAERDKLRDQLETVALERSEKFSSHFERKFKSATNKAKDAVGEERAAAIEALIALPPSKERKARINEIRDDLDGVDQGQLDLAVASYDEARADREEQLKNSKENYKKLMELQQNDALTKKQDAERRAEIAMTKVLEIAKNDIASFKTGDDAEQNAFAAESEDYVKKFFQNKLSQTEVALLPVVAREAKRYETVVVPKLEAKIKELEEAVAQYAGASPKPNGGPPAAPKGDAPKTFIERFNAEWPAGARP